MTPEPESQSPAKPRSETRLLDTFALAVLPMVAQERLRIYARVPAEAIARDAYDIARACLKERDES